MQIIDLIDIGSIDLRAHVTNKEAALNRIIDIMIESGHILDGDAFRQAVFAREAEGTTGVGGGIAIPHGKCSAVREPALAAMVIPEGVAFDALDDQPVQLIFLIAAPDNGENVHLNVLSRLAMMLMDHAFTEKLLGAASKREFLQIIDDKEEKKVDEKAPKDLQPVVSERMPHVLAVTSCPTGIAHTYMAKEALEKAGVEKGIRVLVETRGAAGAEHVFTDEQIREADAVLIAADAKVPMDRFNGKPLIQTSVSEGIAHPGELLERVLGDGVPLYQAESGYDSHNNSFKGESKGHRIYKYLMNGVSHMLPFVVGGGILIALAFLVDGLFMDLGSLPFEKRADFGSITPVAAVLKQIGGVAMGFMLPVLAGYIAEAIADRPGLAAGFAGGMIAAGGRSGFLGAIAAGFLAGFLVKFLSSRCKKLPGSLKKIAPVLIYPLLGVLFIGLVMLFVIEPVMGSINEGLNGLLLTMGKSNRILLGMVLGGMMAIDMGGPFNKAAYVFGTAAIASGNYDLMAAVMVGGMCPPCGVALATILFKTRFTDEEREAGPVNFIMGLAFITEGAIPYAAADPICVLPACIIGSATAGAMSILFGCSLMAPHGGIFVFPVVGQAPLYIVALLAGTGVTALLMGLFKTVRNSR